MTKSIEVTIALMILFFFIFSAIQMNTQKTTLSISEVSRDYLFLKAEEDTFREVISQKDVNLAYDILYTNMDMTFYLRICDYINQNCVYTDESYKAYKNTKTVNYYFSDINKTLNVIFGYN